MLGYGLAAGESTETEQSAKLLRLAKSGDAAAFEALLRSHEAQVARTSLRLLGNRQDAQDAAQEVFLRLHRSLRKIDDAGNLSGWLYLDFNGFDPIAVNSSGDYDERFSRPAVRIA